MQILLFAIFPYVDLNRINGANRIEMFDPLQRSKKVEQIVMQGDKRRYYRFRFADFYGGIITGDQVGCSLCCAYCYAYSRNLNPTKSGTFYDPSEVAGKLLGLAEKHDCDQFRVSGAEPILGRASALHLAGVIRRVDGHFTIETNAIMIGADPTLIDILKPLPNVHVRLCIKAHNGLDFERITGAKADGFAYQLMAVEALRQARISHTIAVMGNFVDYRRLDCRVDEVEDLILYRETKKNLKRSGLPF
jgi:uncharacterized Fe-S cluster-containing radical SAM superfamily protein